MIGVGLARLSNRTTNKLTKGTETVDEKSDYSLHYSRWHNDDGASRQEDIAMYKYILQLHRVFPRTVNDNVLEIGCGMGRLLLALRTEGYQNLKGVDLSAELVSIARREGLDVTSADAVEFLGTTAETYDVIYLFDVLEHIPMSGQLTFLRQLYAKLSPAGFLVLQVPNACSPIASYFRYIDWTHVCSFTEASLEYILRNAGFREINVREATEPSFELVLMRESFRRLYEEELGVLHANPIMSLNLFVVAYKSQLPQNVFFDRLWASSQKYPLLQKESKADNRTAGQPDWRVAVLGRGTFRSRLRRLLDRWRW